MNASSSHPNRRHSTEGIDQLLLRTVDLGLACCIFGVPFLWGGRQALGQFALVALATLVGIAWFSRQWILPERSWRRSAGNLLFAAGLILLILQLIPLPLPLLAKLSPQTSELLPLWTFDSSSHLGAWSQVSLTPAATEGALALYLAYGILFVVTVQRIETIEDVERLLRWVALSAVIMASFGLLQLLVNNGKFFWFLEHPFSNTKDVAKGSFTNRNHFAHFLALGLGPLIWWVQQSLHRENTRESASFQHRVKSFDRLELGPISCLVALGVVLFALLLSLSRGGTLVGFLAMSIAVAVCFRAQRLGVRFVGVLAVVAVLVGISLTIFGYDNVSSRLDTLTAGSLDQVDRHAGRRIIWQTTLQAIPDYLMLGSGSGSLQKVYPIYLKWRSGTLYYTHCENGYLQVALEMGIPGLLLILFGLLLCIVWCWRGLRRSKSSQIVVCVGAVAAGLVASAVHSMADFVWYVPSCMAVVILLAACACRLAQLASTDPNDPEQCAPFSKSFSKSFALVGTLVIVVGGGWIVLGRFGPVMAESHWHRYLTMIQAKSAAITFETPLESRLSPGSNPSVSDPDTSSDADTLEETYMASLVAEQKMIDELEQTLRWDPKNGDAQLKLSTACLRLFHLKQQKAVNIMPLSQIRDGAMSQFDNREALDAWLAVAVGDHYRLLDQALVASRNAVTLCPLEGSGYLHLAELCFLEGATSSDQKAFVKQAMTVRPNDGDVLLQAAAEAALDQDYQNWLLYSQRAFQSGTTYQKQLLQLYIGQIIPDRPADEIHFFLEAFQPKLYALRIMFIHYNKFAQPEACAALYQAYTEALQAEVGDARGKQASDLWMEAATVYSTASNPEAAIWANQNALKCDPTKYSTRFRLATRFVESGQLSEAQQHFEWCLKQKPNRRVEKELRNLMERIDQERRMANRPRAYSTRGTGSSR